MTGVIDAKVSVVTPEDANDLFLMIKELSEFEGMPEQVAISARRLADDIRTGAVHGFIARDGAVSLGMTLYYLAYSTWQGQFVHMEDLYVRPQFRRKGVGRLLWNAVAQLAQKEGMKRLQWNVLDWNKNAISFYEKVGAINLTKTEGWLNYRLDEDGIRQVANFNL